VPGDYTSLGTDGFGRSDTRAALRRHFRIDPESIAVSVLAELARRGEVDSAVPQKAVEKYDLRSEDVPADKDTTDGGSE
jgi:pyruvate dehydrogenase E1 component